MSGMKVLVNGGINLSELDGWWVEAYTPEVGWALGDGVTGFYISSPYNPNFLNSQYFGKSMEIVKRTENPKIVRTTDRLSGGTKIPDIVKSANPIMAAVLDISNPLPGSDDQKCLLSLTIKTLN